jgi:hypothetical protein
MVEKFLPGKETNHAGGSFWEMELGEVQYSSVPAQRNCVKTVLILVNQPSRNAKQPLSKDLGESTEQQLPPGEKWLVGSIVRSLGKAARHTC